MRAGEIFSLTWDCVDLKGGLIILRNTKNIRTRFAYMTDAVYSMFSNMDRGEPNALVFPNRNGQKIVQISETFNRAVEKLGFNDNIADRRFKVTFHTCRHSFASWLVESGADLYSVKELLGHSDFSMTSRYAHLGRNVLQGAVKRMEEKIKNPSCNSAHPPEERKHNLI
jgi:integrase